MKIASRLNLLSMDTLREEIALGRKIRVATKITMLAGYFRLIAKAIREERFADAAINTSKLASIIRMWEVKQKADTLACLKSCAVEASK